MPSDTVSSDPPSSTVDPYTTLGIATLATEAEVRSAYKRLALKFHPDKVAPSERDVAHVAFQNLALAYAILSDPARRRRYDTTGSTSESLDIEDSDFNWSDFFRAQFAELVTTQKIDEFAHEYKGGEEERHDVLKAYRRGKGQMRAVYSQVMLSNAVDDEHRFRELIQAAIESGEVDDYPAFSKEDNRSIERRIQRAKKEAGEAAKHAEDLVEGKAGEAELSGEDEDENDGGDKDEERGEEAPSKKRPSKFVKPPNPTKPAKQSKKSKQEKGGNTGDLAALIQQRHKGRANTFLEDLETKYAGKDGKKRKAEEPPEEAFQKNAAKLKSRKTAEKEDGVEEIEKQVPSSKSRQRRLRNRTDNF